MGAFNWIQFEATCPACKEESTIKAQAHICSDYDGAIERFHGKTYQIGQKMDWWQESDARYADWKDGDSSAGDIATECCYSECLNCGAELYAIINFASCTPVAVADMGLEKDWPLNYEK
jgi:hypothetical protein